MPKINKIQELLTRGVEKIIVKENLEKKLEQGEKLNLKFGIDPTGSQIHIGHMVVIRKLRAFQELGHTVTIIVGDYTARIGDPTGRDKMREPLTEKQVYDNLKTYKNQFGKILDPQKTKYIYQSEWFDKANLKDILEWAGIFTVQQMIDRDMYQRRLKKGHPIGLHEFLYPLMQGYDSVAIKADVEFGGRDQEFNLLIGRTMQEHFGQKPQDILTTKLLVGTDGRKMSKTYNNYISVTENPFNMFGKVMSAIDDVIIDYFILATDVPLEEIKKIERGIKNKTLNPKDAKARLAREIVSIYHGKKEAQKAQEEFEKVFKNKQKPSDMPKHKLKKSKYTLPELLLDSKLVKSKSEAKRIIEQKGVRVNDKIMDDWKIEIEPKTGTIIQVGKRKFVKLI